MFSSSCCLNTFLKLKSNINYLHVPVWLSVKQKKKDNHIHASNSISQTNNINNLINITYLTHPFSGDPCKLPIVALNDIINNYFPNL